MGEIADQLRDDGAEMYAMHVAGLCDVDEPCQYCNEATETRKKRRRPKKARAALGAAKEPT